jgi:hypothetical protein
MNPNNPIEIRQATQEELDARTRLELAQAQENLAGPTRRKIDILCIPPCSGHAYQVGPMSDEELADRQAHQAAVVEAGLPPDMASLRLLYRALKAMESIDSTEYAVGYDLMKEIETHIGPDMMEKFNKESDK